MSRRKRRLRRPVQPVKPKKNIESQHVLTLDGEVTLAMLLDMIPNGMSPGAVEISHADDSIEIAWPIIIDNPNYDRDMRRYDVKLRKYQDRLEQYNNMVTGSNDSLHELVHSLDKEANELSVRLARVRKEREKEELFGT